MQSSAIGSRGALGANVGDSRVVSPVPIEEAIQNGYRLLLAQPVLLHEVGDAIGPSRGVPDGWGRHG